MISLDRIEDISALRQRHYLRHSTVLLFGSRNCATEISISLTTLDHVADLIPSGE